MILLLHKNVVLKIVFLWINESPQHHFSDSLMQLFLSIIHSVQKICRFKLTWDLKYVSNVYSFFTFYLGCEKRTRGFDTKDDQVKHGEGVNISIFRVTYFLNGPSLKPLHIVYKNYIKNTPSFIYSEKGRDVLVRH